ncbi:MAG: DUF2849 domain-containing protein [Pseudomonadota bacterium]
MPRSFTPQVATSNDLLEGDVIYFANGAWVRDLAKAQVARTAQEAEALLTAANGTPLQTVGAVLTDVALTPEGPQPTHFREAFRTRGPSNYFHGRQAELKGV